jgi:rhodanese-related sulfurtransferase
MVNAISPKELKTRLDSGEPITVIDVREEWELDISKVDFATHIPMNEIPARTDEIPQDGVVVFMCKAGGRSARVVEYLQSMGWDNLMNLDRGILGWAADVDPVLPSFYA